MEEIQETDELSSSKQESTEKTSTKTKILYIVIRLLRIVLIVGVFCAILFLFFKMSGCVYDKTQVLEDNIQTKGTIDVYAEKPKTQPLSTFDTGQYNFEIKTSNPNEVNAFVRTHVILVYDATVLPGYDPKSKEPSKNILSQELGARSLQIKDMLRKILVQKTYEDLKGSNNILLVKKELTNQVNHILVNGKISDIYFTEWNIIPTGY